MTQRILSTAPVLLLLLAGGVSAAVAFELDDQYGKKHTDADIFAGTPLIMMAGMARKTPDAMEAWDKALRAKAPSGVRVIGLSNLDDVPFFVPKGSITKALIKQLPKTTVLCDWDGKVYRKLDFPDEATIAVGVFNADGKRLGIVNGEVDDTRMQEVLGLVPR